MQLNRNHEALRKHRWARTILPSGSGRRCATTLSTGPGRFLGGSRSHDPASFFMSRARPAWDRTGLHPGDPRCCVAPSRLPAGAGHAVAADGPRPTGKRSRSHSAVAGVVASLELTRLLLFSSHSPGALLKNGDNQSAKRRPGGDGRQRHMDVPRPRVRHGRLPSGDAHRRQGGAHNGSQSQAPAHQGAPSTNSNTARESGRPASHQKQPENPQATTPGKPHRTANRRTKRRPAPFGAGLLSRVLPVDQNFMPSSTVTVRGT